jgi:hypothetical protein
MWGRWGATARKLKRQWQSHVHNRCLEMVDEIDVDWEQFCNRAPGDNDQQDGEDLLKIAMAVLKEFQGEKGLEIEVIDHYVHLIVVSATLALLEKEGEVEVLNPGGPFSERLYRVKETSAV